MELGIGRRAKGLDGEHGRGRVVPVRVAALGREARDDDVGAKAPDDGHDVGEHGFAAPEAQRLVRALREPEVPRAREELFGAVDASRGEQLLRADEPQLGALLGAHEVLAAVPAVIER